MPNPYLTATVLFDGEPRQAQRPFVIRDEVRNIVVLRAAALVKAPQGPAGDDELIVATVAASLNGGLSRGRRQPGETFADLVLNAVESKERRARAGE